MVDLIPPTHVIYVQMKPCLRKLSTKIHQTNNSPDGGFFFFFGFSCHEVTFCLISTENVLFMFRHWLHLDVLYTRSDPDLTYRCWRRATMLNWPVSEDELDFFLLHCRLWAPCCWYNHGSSGESQKAPVLSPVVGVLVRQLWQEHASHPASEAAFKAKWPAGLL